MSIAAGTIGGIAHTPFMQLEYGAVIRRMSATYTALGSISSAYADLPGITPCDVSPLSDMVTFQQSGQTDMLTHLLHFQAGTDVKVRDEVRIVYAPQPGNFGNVGDTYLIQEVLEPSTDLNYIRCRAFKGKVPTS